MKNIFFNVESSTFDGYSNDRRDLGRSIKFNSFNFENKQEIVNVSNKNFCLLLKLASALPQNKEDLTVQDFSRH